MTNQNLNNIRKLPYTLVRKLVKTGDGLFFIGHKPLSELILQFTEFSHTAVIVRYDEIMPHYPDKCVQVVEASIDGVNPRDFTALVRKNVLKGSSLYWLPIFMTDEQRSLCREYILAEIPLERPYGIGTLVANAFGYQPIELKESRICSEWYAAVLIACGLVDWQVGPKPGDIPTWLGRRAGNLVEIIGPKENELQ